VTRNRPNARRSRAILVATAACFAALALPAAGQADVTTFGSDLSKPANLVRAYGADSAFWSTAIDGDATRGIAPRDGQVTLVKLKGMGPPGGSASPNNQFHFQVLHPIGGGAVRVDLSSQEYYLPAAGSPEDVTSFKPVNFCVHKGDYVDFNDVGGGGVPWQVFSRDPDSITEWYSKDNGTKDGATFSPLEHQQEELLLQSTLASGRDASDICPGGYQQHVFQGAKVIGGQTVVLHTRTRTAKVKLQCPPSTYVSCKGVLSLDATFGNKNILVGSASFNIQAYYTTSVEVKMTSSTVKIVQKAKTLAANVNVQSHDNPQNDKRATENGVPQQSKVTTGNVRIKPDKLAKKKRKKRKKHKKRH
jgi:hypothetical protein